jgi:4-hydroxybenzoate polyprenyltransferase
VNLAAPVNPYLQLIRFDRPIGTLLLLWPTYWALWLSAEGWPDPKLLIIFSLGTFLMRSAGCIVNDYADRNIDGSVERTSARPLATGSISSRNALLFGAALTLAAFVLVLFTNRATVLLSIGAVILAACYPFAKRVTQLPQFVLGAAFSWGIPMAFTAQTGELPAAAWLVFAVNLVWTVMYDTFYAMVDRDDDLRIGVKSTAILLGDKDLLAMAVLQVVIIAGLVAIAVTFNLGSIYFLGVGGAAVLFFYQQWLVRNRQRDDCFKAFLNNNWVGFSIFVGILLHFHLQAAMAFLNLGPGNG